MSNAPKIYNQKNLRKGRYSEPNQIYHITTTIINRVPEFQDLKTARQAINVIRKADDLAFTTTYCFMLMPDHLHWLFQLNEGVTLSQVVKSMKTQTSKTMQNNWQKGFYDHAIRKDEDIQAVARYIIANPVRAGLVKRAGDYPHWDAMWV